MASSTNAAGGTPGEPYCGHCGYLLTGLADSARCPECGRPLVDVLMRREFSSVRGKRYRSKATLLGLPVIDVALGPWQGERIGRARGIIAVGDIATGFLALGGIARGVVAVGGLSVGIFSVGGLSGGLLTAIGGLAVSLGLATGGAAIGTIAVGGGAAGIIAQGGGALGLHTRDGTNWNKPSPVFDHLSWLLGHSLTSPLALLTPTALTLGAAILAASIIGLVALIRLNSTTEQS